MPAMMTACQSLSVLDPTDVANEFATSLAPMPQAMKHDAKPPQTTIHRYLWTERDQTRERNAAHSVGIKICCKRSYFRLRRWAKGVAEYARPSIDKSTVFSNTVLSLKSGKY
eukprot:94657-Chlamydomonas_euryale.AAC.1